MTIDTEPITVACPSCHGQGVKSIQASPAGASPSDTEVKCWYCYGLRTVTPAQARNYEAVRRGR